MHMNDGNRKGMERTLGDLNKKGGARRILTSAKGALQSDNSPREGEKKELGLQRNSRILMNVAFSSSAASPPAVFVVV